LTAKGRTSSGGAFI
jgi:hypothetical protein